MWRYLGVLGLVLLLACSNTGAGNQADAGSSQSVHEDSVPFVEGRSRFNPPESPPPATVGTTHTLSGNSSGELMAVTLVEVVDPAPPKDRLNQPASGTRLVALQIRLENVGSAIYRDSPTNGAALVDAIGQEYSTTHTDVGGGQTLGGSVTINTQDFRLGYVVFEVPDGQVPAKFQFALNSGYARHTGEWNLGG